MSVCCFVAVIVAAFASNFSTVHLYTGMQVLLSLVWHGNKLGVAYYDLDCPQVCFMPDRPELGDFVLLQQSKGLSCLMMAVFVS